MMGMMRMMTMTMTMTMMMTVTVTMMVVMRRRGRIRMNDGNDEDDDDDGGGGGGGGGDNIHSLYYIYTHIYVCIILKYHVQLGFLLHTVVDQGNRRVRLVIAGKWMSRDAFAAVHGGPSCQVQPIIGES